MLGQVGTEKKISRHDLAAKLVCQLRVYEIWTRHIPQACHRYGDEQSDE